MKFGKILVPVCGNSVDREVIGIASRLATENKGKIYIVYVIEVKRSLPLDASIEPEIRKAEVVLDAAEGFADELDQRVKTDLLQAREIGPAIVEESREQGADLILMGVDYKRRFGEFDIGNIIPYVLKNAHCRVLLVRQPLLE